MTSHTEHTLKQLCQVLKAVSVPCGTLTERLHSPTETNWTSATRVSADVKEEPCWVLATWGYPEWPCLHLSVYSILLGTNWFLTLCGRMNIFTVKKGWSNCFSQIYAINVSSFIFYIYLSHEYFCILQIFGPWVESRCSSHSLHLVYFPESLCLFSLLIHYYIVYNFYVKSNSNIA